MLLRFAELSEKFDQIGFQVSLVLPEIFTAFRRAAAHRHGTDESLSAARTSLENKDVAATVGAARRLRDYLKKRLIAWGFGCHKEEEAQELKNVGLSKLLQPLPS